MFRDRHHSSRSGLLVCSPPRSPLPLRHRPQGSRDFSIRAEPASLPSQASDMLAVRTRQLTAEDSHLIRLAALSAAPGTCTLMAIELQGSSLPCGLPGSFYFLSTNGSHVRCFSITLNLPPWRRKPMTTT